MNGSAADNADDGLSESRDLIATGRFQEALAILRSKIRAKISASTTSIARTPVLRFEASDPEPESLEQLFALCAWESALSHAEDAARLSNDTQLLDECITKTSPRSEVPFAVGASWIALKCRPGASRDEINDAQQLLDRYLRQAALASDAGTLAVNDIIRNKYTYLAEMLVCRVLPVLGLLESATSFLSYENSRKDLVREEDRVRLLGMLAPMMSTVPTAPAIEPASPVISTATATAVPEGRSAQASNASSASSLGLDARRLVEEFERQKQMVEAEQARLVMMVGGAVSASLFVALLVSERRRISNVLASVGDALFGE